MLFHCKAIPYKDVSGMSNFQETKRNSDHGDKRHSANSNQTAPSAVTPIPIHRPNPFPPTTRRKDVLDKELLRGVTKNALQEVRFLKKTFSERTCTRSNHLCSRILN